MKKYVTVRVISRDARPASNVRIGLEIFQFLASGFMRDQRTNSSGETTFELDVDSGAECAVWLEGQQAVRRGSIQGLYTLHL